MVSYCAFIGHVQLDLFRGGNDHFSHWRCKNSQQENVKIPKIQLYGPYLRPGNSISRLRGAGEIFSHRPVKNEAARLFSGWMRTPTQRVSTFGPHGSTRGRWKGPARRCVRGFPVVGVAADRAKERGGVPHSPLPSSLPVPPGQSAPGGAVVCSHA